MTSIPLPVFRFAAFLTVPAKGPRALSFAKMSSNLAIKSFLINKDWNIRMRSSTAFE